MTKLATAATAWNTHPYTMRATRTIKSFRHPKPVSGKNGSHAMKLLTVLRKPSITPFPLTPCNTASNETTPGISRVWWPHMYSCINDQAMWWTTTGPNLKKVDSSKHHTHTHTHLTYRRQYKISQHGQNVQNDRPNKVCGNLDTVQYQQLNPLQRL